MKKKLLMILGAGSSHGQGMPSVADINDRMKAWSAEWLSSDPFMPVVDNYYTDL